MIVYRCDLCNEIHDSLGEMDLLSLCYAGKAEVKIYKDGKFHLCSSCSQKILNMLKEAENELKTKDVKDMSGDFGCSSWDDEYGLCNHCISGGECKHFDHKIKTCKLYDKEAREGD